MQLMGIISDTHDERDYLAHALRVFDNYGVESILHCGDIEEPETIEMLSDWQCRVVFGNRDFERDALAEALNEIGATHARNALDFEWAGLRFFVTHGDDRKLLTDAIESQNYVVVCSGHTHVFATGTEGKTLVVNPGAIKFGSFVIIDDKKNVLHNPD